jgi:phage terminase small subunit
MAQEIAVATPQDRSYDGKAMAALTDRQRQFVQSMVQMGVNPKAAARAAAECGYEPNYGYQLMRNDNILAALREESTKKLVGAALVGVNVLLDIAQNGQHKDQFRAAKELAGINGFTAEQRIMVTHVTEDTRQQMVQIREMAEQLGMDPKALIAAAGIVDAEFTEVNENDSQLGVDDSEW